MAQPGDPGWKWFPNIQNDWRLDVVTLLAVIGESSMAEHSQTITASLVCMLPRLLPAPQALLKPSRPTRLPETFAKMAGVYSGTTLDSVGFFANIITPLDALPPYSFKVLEIKHAVGVPPPVTSGQHGPHHKSENWVTMMKTRLLSAKSSSVDSSSSSSSSSGERPSGIRPPPPGDIESGPEPPQERIPTVRFNEDTIGPLRRRTTAKEKMQDLLSSGTMAITGERPAVPAKLLSPIHILSVFSCALSVAILIMAIVWQDGAAILAIFLISSASTVVGYASSWRPILMQRRHTNEVPKGDVMIRTREGAFVLIRCSEDVARELYSGTEECEYYVGGRAYRLLMALGTILLMLSVVLLGNCTWNSQIFIGGSYIVLNGLYWGLGMIPRSYFWDLSRYDWKDVTPDDANKADGITDELDMREGHPSFTRTLWYAIRETEATGWVERSGAAPGTEQWKKWLREALQNAKARNRDWPAVQRKNIIMAEPTQRGEEVDMAAQHAPATEVQGGGNLNPAWSKDASF